MRSSILRALNLLSEGEHEKGWGVGLADELMNWMMELVKKYGYLGAFLASVLGNATIILPAPYSLFIFILGGILDPLLLGAISGLGAAIGELTGYALGAAWRKAVKEEKKRELERAKKLLENPGFIIVFTMAATPLPDDVVSVPLGLMRYPLWKAFLAFLAGKTLLCLILAYSGKLLIDITWLVWGASGLWGMVGTALAIAIITALAILIDWGEILDIIEEKGWRGIFSSEGVKRLLSTIRRGRRKEEEGEEKAEAEGGERAGEEGGGEEAVEGDS